MVNKFEDVDSFIDSLLKTTGKKCPPYRCETTGELRGEIVPSGDINNSNIFIWKCVNISAQMLSGMFSICPLTANLSSQALLQSKIHQIDDQFVLF